MAKKSSKKNKKSESVAGKKALEDRALLKKLKEHQDESDRYVNEAREGWDEKEALLVGGLKDDISENSAKSQVFDPRLSTIVLERASRVMGQLPSGKSMAVSKDDKGKNMLMNLCVDHYALPNANSQWNYLIKSRLLDVYSLVYGTMFGLVDWRIDERTGYVGPDLWIVPIRDAFPQAGAVSVNECEHFQISNLVNLDFLKSRDKETWQGLDEIIKDLEDGGGISRSDLDSKRKSHVEEERHPDIATHQAELITEYRIYGGKKDKGEWITYAPEYEKIVRRIDNPHLNGELPVVAKHGFPLIDSIFGLGEFERGKTLQYAINSLINLYLDGVKMSLFPPMLINPDGVVPSSIKFQPAAKWLIRQPGAVDQLRLNPQGLQTFQSTYSFLNAALLNQAGTTDTATSDVTDPGLGKTPQALKMLSQRESSRDNWDRFMMEQTQEDILRKFVNLISKKQSKPMKLRLFAKEIEEIAEQYPDVIEMYSSGDRGEVTVNSKQFESVDFDYEIVPGSTMQADKEKELSAVMQLLELIIKNPGIRDEMRAKGKDVDIAELITRFVSMSGLSDWEKVVTDFVAQEQAGPDGQPGQPMPQQQVPQFEDPAVAQLAQNLMNGIGGIPTQS